MDFEEISNEEWSFLAPTLCIQSRTEIVRRGRPRIQPRVLANAILWVLTIGGSWSKLPTRYPSSTTCRYRFEEWRLDGKLDEMVRILSAAGRNFSYVHDSSYPQKNTAINGDVPPKNGCGLPRVRWRSQGTWQASHGPPATVQKSSDPVKVGASTRAAMEAVSPPESSLAHRTPSNFAQEHCDSSPRAFWMGLVSNGTTVIDARGYVIYVAVDTAPDAMFRGWTEIIRDGKRVARSGLVGPRFRDPDAGMQFALAWARRWIESHANRARIHDG
jgi:transposase